MTRSAASIAKTRELSREAKRRRRGRCRDCGTETGYMGQPERPVSDRCPTCANRARRLTRAECIAAMQAYHAETGLVPSARRWRAERRSPSVNGIQHTFGSWSAGVLAAGFHPRPPGRPAGSGPR